MTNNIFDLFEGQLSEGMLDQLSQQIGGADKKQTAVAASGIVNTLIGALAKNAQTEEGARSLNSALEKDHDGSVVDSFMDLLGGAQQQVPSTQQRALNGEGIVRHVLGNKQGNAVSMISKISGLDSQKTGNLMTTLAPMVMGMLGKQKRQQGLDMGGLVSMLNGAQQQQRQADNPTMALVTRFLDADGDGSVLDDVAGIGMKFLGNLFGRKR